MVALALEVQHLPHRGRPLCDICAVGMEHGHGEAVHSEGNAAGMRRLTRRIDDIPGGAEMVAMIIETHASCRCLVGADRDQQFKLQRLFNLVI